jgi:hypothetical protein
MPQRYPACPASLTSPARARARPRGAPGTGSAARLLSERDQRQGMPGPFVARAPGAISSDRAHWHPAGTGFRGWNSTGRTRVLPPVGALVSPGPDHCLHGIPSGWSHDAPFAVRRPAHRLGTPSRADAPGALSCLDPSPRAAIQLLRVSSRPAGPGELPSSSARPAPRSSSGAPISQAEPSTAGSPPMIGATEPSSPAAWPVSVRYPGSPADRAGSGSCPGERAGSSSDHVGRTVTGHMGHLLR